MKTTLLSIGIALCMVNVYAQLTHTEKSTKEFTFEKKDVNNTLLIENINGSVAVTGYSGDKIVVEVTRTVRAKTQARFDKAKEEVKMGVIDLADSIILYSSDGCTRFGRGTPNNRDRNGWSYNWNERDGCRTEYEFELDFVVKVPAGINIDVSTINNGDVAVQGVTGIVIANQRKYKITEHGARSRSEYDQRKPGCRVYYQPEKEMPLLYTQWRHQRTVSKGTRGRPKLRKFQW
jgi:hypothetical protein